MTWKWVRDRGSGPFHAVSEDADLTATMYAVCLERISTVDLQVHAYGAKIDRGGQCEFCIRLTQQLAQADRESDGPDGKPTPEQLRAEYEQGKSILGLAIRHHMATNTVKTRLARAGTILRPSAAHAGEEDRDAYKRHVLDALAGQPGHELSCADLAEQLGLKYDVAYRTLQRLANTGLVTSRDPEPHENRGRRPYRLTPPGVQTQQAQPDPSAPEPPITATTAQVLLALLQPPIRSWRAVDLANRVRCQINTVIRLAAALEPAGWASTRRSTTEHNAQRVAITLTEHGVNQAKAALWREYGDGPGLVLLANSMNPPVQPVEV